METKDSSGIINITDHFVVNTPGVPEVHNMEPSLIFRTPPTEMNEVVHRELQPKGFFILFREDIDSRSVRGHLVGLKQAPAIRLLIPNPEAMKRRATMHLV